MILAIPKNLKRATKQTILPSEGSEVIGTLPPPQPGPQTMFLESDAEVVIMGGAAGGSKTFSLLLDFARPELLANPQYGGVIFRRTYPQIHNEGGLWDEAARIYPQIGGVAKQSDSEWQFPSGATIRFAHLQHAKNVYDWQGSQLVRIGWDEATHFEASQFWYLFSRNRSTSGIKPVIRATTNPDADSWVAELIDWWIGEDGLAIPERSGVIRYFARVGGQLQWADTSEELKAIDSDIEPKSFTFIAARIYDNPILLEKDPGYLANLKALHPVERERLLGGNWKVRLEAGKIYNRSWFEAIDILPELTHVVRFWDLAATEIDYKTKPGEEPCYTAGVKMGRDAQGVFYVLDVIEEFLGPAQADDRMLELARLDEQGCAVRWELEGGSAGKRDAYHLSGLLEGFDAMGVRPQGDKVTRSKPAASAAANGRVRLLRGQWNNLLLNRLHSFPDAKQKDVPDAFSGAYAYLVAQQGKAVQKSRSFSAF